MRIFNLLIVLAGFIFISGCEYNPPGYLSYLHKVCVKESPQSPETQDMCDCSIEHLDGFLERHLVYGNHQKLKSINGVWPEYFWKDVAKFPEGKDVRRKASEALGRKCGFKYGERKKAVFAYK